MFGLTNINNNTIINIIIKYPIIIHYIYHIDKQYILNILDNLDENIVIDIIKRLPFIIQYIENENIIHKTQHICNQVKKNINGNMIKSYADQNQKKNIRDRVFYYNLNYSFIRDL
jgi:hypothetical protein